MSFKSANKAKADSHKAKHQADADAPPKDQPRSTLRVHIEGEDRDIGLDLIDGPLGVPDRLPRADDDVRLAELARSMSEQTQLQRIMVEEMPDGRFVRVFGRRRILAAILLKWPTIKAFVCKPLPPDIRRAIMAIENVQRQSLTPAEETLAVGELMELQAIPAAIQLARPLNPACGAWSNKTVLPARGEDVADWSRDAQQANRHDMLLDHRVRGIASELVAAMLGKPASWVRDRMYIGRLSEKARALMHAEKLPLAHAREIAKVADEKLRDQLAKDYAAGGNDSISDTEAGKLEELQEEVRKQVFALHGVPWNLDVHFAGKVACNGCPNNSATQPGLFEHGGEVSTHMIGGRGTYDSTEADSKKANAGGVCTLASCYAEKNRAAKGAISAAAKRIVDSDPKKPKKGAVASAAANVTAKVPDYVDRKALAKKVEDRRKTKRAPGSATKSPVQSAASKAAKAKREAFNEWREAMQHRAVKFEERLQRTLNKTPGLWTLLNLLTNTKAYDATHSQQEKAIERAMSAPLLHTLVKAAANPSWESVKLIEQHLSYRSNLLDDWQDARTGMIELIAKEFGVEMDPAPTVESFLPKAAVKTIAKAVTTPAAKPAATKPVKCPKREPDHVESAGDEGGDE